MNAAVIITIATPGQVNTIVIVTVCSSCVAFMETIVNGFLVVITFSLVFALVDLV